MEMQRKGEFKKMKSYNINYEKESHEGKTHKFKYVLFGFLALIVLSMVAYATTILSDNKVSTPIINSSIGINNGTYSSISSRPLTSENPRNITVCASGCDYTTIQEAINQVPYFLRHRYIIKIGNGVYDENIIIPPIIVSDTIYNNQGPVEALEIRGNTSDMNLVKIKSIQITGQVGAQNPLIQYVTVYGTDDYSNENVSISIYGSNHPILKFINITSVAINGIMSYGSSVSISGIDFGNNNLLYAMDVKHGGSFYSFVSLNVPSYGTVQRYVYVLEGGNIYSNNDNIKSGIGLYYQNPTATGFGVKTEETNETINGVNSTDYLFGIQAFKDNIKEINILSNRSTKTINAITYGNSSTDYGYLFQNAGPGRTMAVYNSLSSSSQQVFTVKNDGGGAGIYLDNNGNGIGMVLDDSGTSPPLQIIANVTNVQCTSGREGGIYYDGSTHKHYGCNGTTWNALY